MEPGRKTATVWGTLPGETDETIYVLGHRDGWFEAATDNASGVATTVGLAEYFAKVPKRNGSGRWCSSGPADTTTAPT